MTATYAPSQRGKLYGFRFDRCALVGQKGRIEELILHRYIRGNGDRSCETEECNELQGYFQCRNGMGIYSWSH